MQPKLGSILFGYGPAYDYWGYSEMRGTSTVQYMCDDLRSIRQPVGENSPYDRDRPTDRLQPLFLTERLLHPNRIFSGP